MATQEPENETYDFTFTATYPGLPPKTPEQMNDQIVKKLDELAFVIIVHAIGIMLALWAIAIKI